MAIRKLNLSGHDNADLASQNFDTFKLQVDLADPSLQDKTLKFLIDTVGLKSDDTVIMAAPGLAPLAILIVTQVHGITGSFPTLVPLVRGSDGFTPGNPMDLQSVRMSARMDRADVTVL